MIWFLRRWVKWVKLKLNTTVSSHRITPHWTQIQTHCRLHHSVPRKQGRHSAVTMNEVLVKFLFFPRKLFALATVASPIGPSLDRIVTQIIIRSMSRYIRERTSHVVGVAVTSPPGWNGTEGARNLLLDERRQFGKHNSTNFIQYSYSAKGC